MRKNKKHFSSIDSRFYDEEIEKAWSKNKTENL